MKKEQLIQFLESFAPKNLAMDWDNVGFLLGKREGEVKRVFITLDVDCRAVEAAIGTDCDFILSHHPFLFKGIKAITEEEPSGRKILSLMEHGISVFSMHTNFDAVNMGMADLLARTLGWKKEGVMEERKLLPEPGQTATFRILFPQSKNSTYDKSHTFLT